LLESRLQCDPSSWTPDGKAVIFTMVDPQPLFDLEGIWYEPNQDGQRFLTFAVTERAPAPPIHVVLNWAVEMKK
jgi:hypothetical protein